MSKYTIGRSYEYKAKKELEAQGYTVIRTAGSHGPWDIVAFREGEPVRCIQIKTTKAPGGVKSLFSRWTPDQLHQPATPTPESTYKQELWVWYKGRWHFSLTEAAGCEASEDEVSVGLGTTGNPKEKA